MIELKIIARRCEIEFRNLISKFNGKELQPNNYVLIPRDATVSLLLESIEFRLCKFSIESISSRSFCPNN